MAEIIKNHKIEWRHDGLEVVGIICCNEPTTAPCHACDDGCSHGSNEGPQHLECLVSSDIMYGLTALYSGDRVDVHSGPIEIVWDGSDYAWWYEGDSHASFEPDERDRGIVDVIADLSDLGEIV